MIILFILIIVVSLLIVTARDKRRLTPAMQPPVEEKLKPTVRFRYRRKDFLMSRSENDFFNVINRAIGDNFYVFPQIHLSEILDHRVKYQNYEHALRYINQKSVDYVICDREYRRPLLAIELDDPSHDNDERKLRDVNVEYMLSEARIPLLRFRNVSRVSEEENMQRIRAALPQPKPIQPVQTEKALDS